MTHIVILFNRTFQELSKEIEKSPIKNFIANATKQSFESANFWTKLDSLIGLPQKADPQVLNITPIKVELGMRDSQCHTLTAKNSVISDRQMQDFNAFFSGVFQIVKLENANYQIHFKQFLKFNLAIKHLPPQLNDYRRQIEAAESNLKSHLTELQAWCYKQQSMWNAFYLWSQPRDEVLATINLDDRTQLKSIAKLNVFKTTNLRAQNKIILLDEPSSLSFDLMKYEQQFKDSKIDKLSIGFADTEFYEIQASHFYPWWKKLFKRA